MLLHEIDFGQGEAKGLVSLDPRVASPVLVLGRRIVQVLRRENKRGKEDSVNRTPHPLGHRWQPLLEAGEVNERAHQSRDLNVRAVHKRLDKFLKRGECRLKR